MKIVILLKPLSDITKFLVILLKYNSLKNRGVTPGMRQRNEGSEITNIGNLITNIFHYFTNIGKTCI